VTEEWRFTSWRPVRMLTHGWSDTEEGVAAPFGDPSGPYYLGNCSKTFSRKGAKLAKIFFAPWRLCVNTFYAAAEIPSFFDHGVAPESAAFTALMFFTP
jgi:hypothetical protein